MNKTPVRQSSLSSQILGILVEQIRNGTFPPDTPLPPENQLAANYKVSRATIRSAFDRLEAMGLIIRRQGIGTFVRKSSNISNLLNQFIDFPNLIADNGYEPGFEQLRTELVDPSPEQLENFKLTSGDKLLEIEKVKQPMAYPEAAELAARSAKSDSEKFPLRLPFLPSGIGIGEPTDNTRIFNPTDEAKMGNAP